MIWQDIVMMAVCFSFAVALIPTVRAVEKPAKVTCAWTGLGLFVLAGCMGSLDLWLSMSSNILAGGVWLLLLFQRRRT